MKPCAKTVAAWLVLSVTLPGPAVCFGEDFIQGYVPRPVHTLTFSRDIAPIIFENCTGCHRPVQSGPFSLVDFAGISKRSRLICDVVGNG